MNVYQAGLLRESRKVVGSNTLIPILSITRLLRALGLCVVFAASDLHDKQWLSSSHRSFTSNPGLVPGACYVLHNWDGIGLDTGTKWIRCF